MAAAIPLLIKGGMALGGSLLGSKLSKSKSTPEEKAALGQTAQAQNLGLGAAKGTLPQAQNLIGMGSQAYQPVLNYWSSILSGNRGAMTSALAPEVSQIGQGYRTAAQTSAALNPRGGPSASFLSELPFQQQRDVSTLFQQARPQAAQGLLAGAQGATGAGSALLSNAIQSLYSSTAAGRSILEAAKDKRAEEAQRGRSIGGGIFDMITKYGFPAVDQMFKGGGGGGGGGSSYSPD